MLEPGNLGAILSCPLGTSASGLLGSPVLGPSLGQPGLQDDYQCPPPLLDWAGQGGATKSAGPSRAACANLTFAPRPPVLSSDCWGVGLLGMQYGVLMVVGQFQLLLGGFQGASSPSHTSVALCQAQPGMLERVPGSGADSS